MVVSVYDPLTGRTRQSTGIVYDPIRGSTRPNATSAVQAASRVANTSATRAPVAPSAPGGGGGGREEDIDWRDASYWAQLASIDRALRDFETGLGTRVNRYGEDYTRGTKDLGYRTGEGFVAAPDILPFRTMEEGMAAIRRPGIARAMGATAEGGAPPMPSSAAEALGGRWDYEGEFNPYSAATRGTRTARDEFAGRGMLRSSDFAQSYAEFQDRLNQQLEAMETGRGRFLEDAVTNLAQQRATAQERRESAARDAMMRAAIMAGGG